MSWKNGLHSSMIASRVEIDHSQGQYVATFLYNVKVGSL